MTRTFSRDLVTALARGRIASDSRSLFIMDDPAARHSAPNHSCPARLSVIMSSAKLMSNKAVMSGVHGF